jgi:hypothetical protein
LLEFLSRAELKEYKLSNFRVTMLNDEAAVVIYRAEARARIQGEEVALRSSVTAGWAKRGGRSMSSRSARRFLRQYQNKRWRCVLPRADQELLVFFDACGQKQQTDLQ